MKKLFFLLTVISSSLAQAKVQIVTTLPDIAEIVSKVGGDSVAVTSLLSGSEDPHFAESRPSYILKLRKADLVCFVGMDLESAWLLKSLERAGNKKAQENISHCDLGKRVEALDIPTGAVNRSLGDVHIHGNPHYLLSPRRIQTVATAVAEELGKIAPAEKETFKKNAVEFNKTVQSIYESLQKEIKPVLVMEYHKEFTYFFNDYGLKSQGSLEEKPGMPPSSKRIAEAARMAKAEGVKVLLATPSSPHKILERFTELSGIPVAIVPSYVQTSKNTQAGSIEDLQKLLKDAVNR